jgi:hypothetical protein
MHNLNREDSHETKVLSCWYYEGNMKYVSMRIGPCHQVHIMFLLFEPYVVRASDSVLNHRGFKLPLDDKALVPLPTPQSNYEDYCDRH